MHALVVRPSIAPARAASASAADSRARSSEFAALRRRDLSVAAAARRDAREAASLASASSRLTAFDRDRLCWLAARASSDTLTTLRRAGQERTRSDQIRCEI